eukprot:6172184-Pleurochrysis_carterae.AAC.1
MSKQRGTGVSYCCKQTHNTICARGDALWRYATPSSLQAERFRGKGPSVKAGRTASVGAYNNTKSAFHAGAIV